MKREIKFRAWTGTEMITPPNETIGSGSHADIIELSIAGNISRRNAYGLDGFTRNPTLDEPEKEIELMQFTGKKDKNGADIYEGDIINAEYGIGKVYFCETTAQFKYEFTIDSDALWLYNSKAEVIGNIYENPELLTDAGA